MPFGKLQAGYHVPFTEEWLLFGHLPQRPDWCSAADMVVLLEGSPISTEELNIYVRVTSLYTIMCWSSVNNSFDLIACFFALTCTVNCGTLNRQVCSFPNHVQSTEFTSDGLQSNCRTNSRMINGNRMHLISIMSCIAKCLNAELNVFFSSKACFCFVIMGYCV